jgi:hypothetical protein
MNRTDKEDPPSTATITQRVNDNLDIRITYSSALDMKALIIFI